MAAPLILSAASSLLNGSMNSIFNQMNMDYQNGINKDLMNYQWEHFSSPKAQVRALADAGISPAHAFGSGGTGAFATPQASGVTAPSPQIGGVDFMDSLLKDTQRKQMTSEKENIDVDTESKRIENITKLRENLAKIDKILSDTNLSRSQRSKIEREREQIEIDIQTLDKRNKQEIALKQSEQTLNEKKAALTDANIQYQQIVNQFEPKQRRALIAEYYAHIDELRAAAKSHDADALDKAADVALKKLDKSVKDSAKQALIDKIRAEADYEAYKAGNEGKRYAYGRVGYEMPIGKPSGDSWDADLPNYNPRHRYHD